MEKYELPCLTCHYNLFHNFRDKRCNVCVKFLERKECRKSRLKEEKANGTGFSF